VNYWNKYKILLKHDQSTHLIQIASKRTMRYAQKRSAFNPKYVNYCLLINLEYCKCAKMRFHDSNGLVVLRFCSVASLRGDIAGGIVACLV